MGLPHFFLLWMGGWLRENSIYPHGPDAFMVDAPGRRVGSFCRAWRKIASSKTRVDLMQKNKFDDRFEFMIL